MREFLVEITTTVPDGTDPAEVDRRRAAEAVRARELAATGNLVRLWRPVGAQRSLGLWRASDETDLHTAVAGVDELHRHRRPTAPERPRRDGRTGLTAAPCRAAAPRRAVALRRAAASRRAAALRRHVGPRRHGAAAPRRHAAPRHHAMPRHCAATLGRAATGPPQRGATCRRGRSTAGRTAGDVPPG
jgi:muconolactone D-isomerase